MAKRALSREELESIGLSSDEVERALSLQKQKVERRFKYIVRLTPSEADQLTKQTGKKFVRATEYRSKAKSDNA